MSKVIVISRFFWSMVLISGVSMVVMPAQAGPFDFSVEQRIGPGQTFDGKVTFTKDGNFNGDKLFQFINGTNMTITRTFTATAPTGTNDREYQGSSSPVATAANNLPHGQFPDYGDFLAANGFIGSTSTLDSPLAIGDLNLSGALDLGDVSIFALIDNINSFLPFADESNFSIGSLFVTDSSGHIPGLPGLTFYQDPGFTTQYANSQLLVTGVISESVPEPSSLLLLGIGFVALLGYGGRRKQPVCGQRRSVAHSSV